jgi:hypothetical protein
MVAPELIPNCTRLRIKYSWLERPAAAIGISPNFPVMIMVAEFPRAIKRFWSIIGRLSLARRERKFLSHIRRKP